MGATEGVLAEPGQNSAAAADTTAPVVTRRPPPAPTVRADPTCREQILDAMAALEQRHGRRAFETQEIVAEVRRRGTQLAESTIRTHITSVMCVDAPPNHPTRFPDLRRVDRGVYERIQ